MTWEGPPRATIASRSRARWAQHRCRRQGGYPRYALQRSGTTDPQQRSPKSAWATAARRDIGPSFRHRLGHGPHGRLRQMSDGPHAARDPTEVWQHGVGRARRAVRRPGAQRDARLHPWAEAPGGDSWRHLRPRRGATSRADQWVQLIRGDHGLHGWDLGHLLPLGLPILSRHGLLAVPTALGLDGHDPVHLCHRHQPPGVSLVPGWSAGPPPGGRAPRPLGQRFWGIARRRARCGPRVLLPRLLSRLDRRLQRRHPGFEDAEIGLRLWREALPDCW
jgi:hypothetical protein